MRTPPVSESGPSYQHLARDGELTRRVEALARHLSPCSVCPRHCGVDRSLEPGFCGTGIDAVVATWTPHFGEEPVISGDRGSGTVFLAGCNLRCVFCQNHEISQPRRPPAAASCSVEQLASVFLELQDRGCHNLNWVSPTHQVPQLVAALELAWRRGLHLPVVYNSNGFESVEVLRLLEGVVDVWLPDLKYADAATAAELSGAEDYPGVARAALAEMYRQVGEHRHLSSDGTLQRGLLVRLLVLPNGLADVADSLQWISEELSPRVGISLMAQYFPSHNAGVVEDFPLLSRTISAGEWARAVDALERFMEGDHHWVQELDTAPEYYRPDFSDPAMPFRDIEDFTGVRHDAEVDSTTGREVQTGQEAP